MAKKRADWLEVSPPESVSWRAISSLAEFLVSKKIPAGIAPHDRMGNRWHRLIGLVVRIPNMSMLPCQNEGKLLQISFKVCVFSAARSRTLRQAASEAYCHRYCVALGKVRLG